MSAAVEGDAPRICGAGWAADVHQDHIYIAVAPWADALPVAISELIAPPQRRYWMVEWSHENDDGSDVYLATRNRPGLHPLQAI